MKVLLPNFVTKTSKEQNKDKVKRNDNLDVCVFIKCILFDIYFSTKKDLDIFWKGYFLIPNQSFSSSFFLTFSFQETKGTIISFLLNILSTLAKCKCSCYVLMKMKYVDD